MAEAVGNAGMKSSLAAEARDVWDGLRLRPGRTALSGLAIGLGMAATTLLLAALGGLQRQARAVLAELGGRVLAIEAGAELRAGGAEPVRADAAVLAACFPDSDVAAARSRFVALRPEDGGGEVRLIETDERWARVRNWRAVRGRLLDARDARLAERHALISLAASRRQGWDVGRHVALEGLTYTIVGVAAPAGGGEGEGGEPWVCVPWMPSGAAGGGAGVEALILMRIPPDAAMGSRVAAARRALAAGRAGPDRYRWLTPDDILLGVRRMRTAVGWAVGSVALLCLVLGGTTLSALMVANVRERMAEIGLRRALGARPADVGRLFLLEGVAVSGAAALAGAGVAQAALGWLGGALPLPLRLDAATLLTPVALTLILGAALSYWPARAAARILPAEALRAE